MKKSRLKNSEPLANILRPQNLNELWGQEKLLGRQSWLRQALKKDYLPSLIFWGPPGSGKTSLAQIISKEIRADFYTLSATSSGLKDLRELIDKAEINWRLKIRTILFIDEIHRWNKAQQDALLPFVEKGILVLIGATTENPSFSINSALLSRSKVLVLEKLDDNSLRKIIKKGADYLSLSIDKKALSYIIKMSAGDARQALNFVDLLSNLGEKIDLDLIKSALDQAPLLYDKNGDEHYNIISALHKSLRGSDAKASLYWLARMIEAGEDPLYIARRLIRFASEDIGLANNSALMVANNAYDACAKIGLPECQLALAQCVLYLAKSKKSIAVYHSYNLVLEEIKTSGSLPVPLHLRNAPTKLLKDLGYGKGYKYSPLEDDSSQEYLPTGLKNQRFKSLKID